ncbi:cupredoxin domain-containing protein [Candidatus Uhrbacteria bacterium]|nr:cupredoxin domain-containing protein [Candidatus Uhrbacteria bacterium]
MYQKLLPLFAVVILAGAGCLSQKPVAVDGDIETQAPVQTQSSEAVTETVVVDAEAPAQETSETAEVIVTDETTVVIQEEGVSQGVVVPSVVEFNVAAKQWAFEPSTITVKKGQTVRLSVTSADVAHGLAIPAFAVTARLEPGKTTSVEFTADQTGSFPFFCNVICGEGHSGMKGTLIVTE